METQKTYIIPSIILGFALVLAAVVGSIAVVMTRDNGNTIAVTGSAKQSVTSDIAKWNGTFTRTVKVSALKTGYIQISADEGAVRSMLTSLGFADKDYTISPVFMEENFDYNPNRPSNAEKEYNLRQTVTLSSNDIQKVTNVAKKVTELASSGILISTQSVEYSYSKLPELRVSLLSDALKDAKARATSLSSSGGSKVGGLKNASSGVVQVVSPNSVEVSDYGTYDTSSIEKDIMVTVKASFYIK